MISIHPLRICSTGLIALAGFLLLYSCTGEKNRGKNTVVRLDSLFNDIFKKNEPGGAVLVARDDQVIYRRGFGLADIQRGDTIHPGTLFNLGSVSKTFVAYGILQLASQKKLLLDDDLHKYFPDFTDTAISKSIRIYHLLTHTSGLPDNRNVASDSVYYLTAKDEENWEPEKKVSRLDFSPGEKFNYSNPAFNGLALIIEKVSGMKWQTYLTNNILRPAGMKYSTITDGPHPQSGVAHGYLASGNNFIEKDYGEEPTFAASGNGGVWSSVDELWKYEQAIRRYLFLDRSWISQSRKVYPHPGWKDSLPPVIGLCWFIQGEGSEKMIGHTGSQGGFRADYVWWPAKNLFYVILCNTPKELTAIRTSVLQILEGR